jgi:predicted GNAT family acetyltransferase
MSSYKNKLRNLANTNNFNVINLNRGGNNKVRLLYKKNKTRNTYVNVNVPWINEPGTLYISHGKTRPNLRKQGLGTKMRALVTLAAKRAGYKRMRQISTYLNNTQKKNYPNAPPSSRIMNKLGFRRNGNVTYVFEFNTMNNNKLKKYL